MNANVSYSQNGASVNDVNFQQREGISNEVYSTIEDTYATSSDLQNPSHYYSSIEDGKPTSCTNSPHATNNTQYRTLDKINMDAAMAYEEPIQLLKKEKLQETDADSMIESYSRPADALEMTSECTTTAATTATSECTTTAGTAATASCDPELQNTRATYHTHLSAEPHPPTKAEYSYIGTGIITENGISNSGTMVIEPPQEEPEYSKLQIERPYATLEHFIKE